MKKRTRVSGPADSDDVRNRVLATSFELFTENGYAGTSTLEIASRARVSKRDLYAAFPTKQDMLIACIEGRTAKLRLPTGLPEPRSREMLASILTEFSTTLLTETTHPTVVSMFRLAIAEADHSPEVARALEATRGAIRQTITELFNRAQAASLLSAGQPAAMATQYLALLWEDTMLRMLLGVAKRPTRAELGRRVAAAVAAFFALHASR